MSNTKWTGRTKLAGKHIETGENVFITGLWHEPSGRFFHKWTDAILFDNELREYRSHCCDVLPMDTVDVDSVDGDYGVPKVVAMGRCQECKETSRFRYVGE